MRRGPWLWSVLGVLMMAAPLLANPPADKGKYWGDVKTAPAFAIAGGKAVARLVHEGGSYMGLLEGSAGLVVPEHIHPESTELLYVLQGGGTMVIDGREATVRAGMAIQVPAGIKHSFRIPKDAKERFVAVQVYTVAGPQTRFRKGKPVPSGDPK